MHVGASSFGRLLYSQFYIEIDLLNTLQHWNLADWTHNGIPFPNGQQTFWKMFERMEECEFKRSL